MAYVIAEIGLNHGGDADLAVKMIESAAESGADAVKFQSFYASDLYFPDHELYSLFEACELDKGVHRRLRQAAEQVGVDFLSTPFSVHWVEILDSLNPAGFKIASMDINNPVLQKAVAKTGRPVYLSTGASSFEEIKTAVKRLKQFGASDLCVLHCVANYPTKPEEAMLWMIPKMIDELECRIGFSDHTIGIETPLKAVALGAQVIEKHFTIDKSLPGPDNALSCDPAELKKLLEGLKDVKPVEIPSPQRDGQRPDMKSKASRRGIYAGRDIADGEIITLDMLKLVRPEATPLERLDTILEEPAHRAYKVGEAL
jgi:sialic acid synthase SpsE